ncbi:MAG: glutaredoxin [Rikenellaceae bacterium]|nr:glutaredoxin [Rikenellaceae bacterium]
MAKLTLFYLRNCPFCKRALQYIDELKAEHEELRAIEIEMIEESEQPEVADRYDYYYVPTLYLGEEKLHEGGIYKEEVEALLRNVLKRIE